jgi:hypothetical protein
MAITFDAPTAQVNNIEPPTTRFHDLAGRWQLLQGRDDESSHRVVVAGGRQFDPECHVDTSFGAKGAHGNSPDPAARA